jgi:hypothetical protein
MFAKIALATAIGAGALALSVPASFAMPMAPLSAPNALPVQTVAWDCGVGWHADPWGRCVPNRPVYRHHWHRPIVIYRSYGWHQRWRPDHDWHHRRDWHHRHHRHGWDD